MSCRPSSESIELKHSDHDFSDRKDQELVLNFAKEWFTRYL